MPTPQKRRLAWSALFLASCVASCVASCGGGAKTPPLSAGGTSWPEADLLFHQNPQWLGADSAYSIDLGGARSLWLFGDTFVATTPANVRSQAALPRNTIALQEGRDPTTAAIHFFWGTNASGKPTSFFPDGSGAWTWPGDGIRLPTGELILFLFLEQATPEQGLGFASAGWRVAIVDDPDGDPSTWTPRYVDPPPSSLHAIVGSAVTLDGDHLVALASTSDAHPGLLARFLPTDLLGGIVTPEWWTGNQRGWVAEAALTAAPAVVIDNAGSEGSIHWDAVLSSWLHVMSRGFGKTTVAVRFAPAVTGPWSAPVDAFTPLESLAANPFVYAAKAHPELTTGDPAELVATYATNSFTPSDLLTSDGMASLYWPRFVRLTLHD